MKRNWIRNLIGGLSFASALFIFQACYGTPQDLQYDMYIEGLVKSGTSGLPIKGIKISVGDGTQWQLTGDDGKFGLYTIRNDTTRISFEDADPLQYGAYQKKDTVITGLQGHFVVNVYLDPK